jgi:hypothetical protein
MYDRYAQGDEPDLHVQAGQMAILELLPVHVLVTTGKFVAPFDQWAPMMFPTR